MLLLKMVTIVGRMMMVLFVMEQMIVIRKIFYKVRNCQP